MLILLDVIHLATCCHKNQLHNFAVRGYFAITFFGYLKNNEKMPMQYLAIFHGCKNDDFQIGAINVSSFQMKNLDIFLFSLKT